MVDHNVAEELEDSDLETLEIEYEDPCDATTDPLIRPPVERSLTRAFSNEYTSRNSGPFHSCSSCRYIDVEGSPPINGTVWARFRTILTYERSECPFFRLMQSKIRRIYEKLRVFIQIEMKDGRLVNASTADIQLNASLFQMSHIETMKVKVHTCQSYLIDCILE
jgi:hypothetical protein